MSDIKIGDKVVGIKGATRVAGIVMNIKEGHVHIKSPVPGVYAPVVNIVPLHKVTKLGEGAMKRKYEDEDHSGMDDYLAQKAEEEKKKKKKKEVKEETAKAVTNKNQEHAVHVAGQPVTAYPNATQAQRVGIKLKDMLGKNTVSVHHMGEEVEQINEKSMYRNKPVKMTAHTEKDGKVYKGTHTVIVKKVPTLDTPTIQAQTKKRAENSLKAHLKSRGHTVTDIEHLEEAPNYRTHGSYDRGSNDIFDRSRRGFKSREHEFEAEVEARHHAAQAQHDSEPHHIYINGRVWKKDGQPVAFNGKKHANAAGLSILKKDPTKDVKIAHHSFHANHGDTMPTSNS